MLIIRLSPNRSGGFLSYPLQDVNFKTLALYKSFYISVFIDLRNINF
jgi:hypothetical protein